MAYLFGQPLGKLHTGESDALLRGHILRNQIVPLNEPSGPLMWTRMVRARSDETC